VEFSLATGSHRKGRGALPRSATGRRRRPKTRATFSSCALQGVSDASGAQPYHGATQHQANVRFFHMKQRFGVDPRFPIERYVTGLRSRVVPDRDGEHPGGSASYVGTDGKGTA
jgi:hypothetical protein